MFETYDHNPNGSPTATGEWTPVLKGDVFCAPACGCGCTKAEHDHACKAAKILVAKLGAGWEEDVWENCGWHYRATKHDSEVTPEHNETQFNAVIRIGNDISISESDEDPRKAVAKAILGLKEVHSRASRALASLALDPLEIGEISRSELD